MDRIGLVGMNGVGKTTLLDVLAGIKSPDAGEIRRFGAVAYARQFDDGMPVMGIGKAVESEFDDKLALAFDDKLAFEFDDKLESIFDEESASVFDAKLAKEFCVSNPPHEYMSGGERTRHRVAKALSARAPLLLADEPTSNLDLDGIRRLEEQLLRYDGAFILVSHDRALMDAVCNRIWELESGMRREYDGNYSEYVL